MLIAETALLATVRETLRESIGLQESECDLEPDENVPAIAGNEYVVVLPGGMSAGPRHNTSGGVWDLLFGFRVVVFHRITHVPRDRRRNVLLDRVRGLNARLDQIIAALDFNNTLISEATAELNKTGTPKGQFIECAKFNSVDARPQSVSFEPYDAHRPNIEADPILALKRGVGFGGCRFMASKD